MNGVPGAPGVRAETSFKNQPKAQHTELQEEGKGNILVYSVHALINTFLTKCVREDCHEKICGS